MAKITSQPTRPNCRCCGIPLQKGTRRVYRVDVVFKSKAEVQATLPPGEVVVGCSFQTSVWQHDPVTGRGAYINHPQPVVYHYSTWDGVSYGKDIASYNKATNTTVHNYPGVCSKGCLEHFAVAAAAAFPDFRMPKHPNA